MKSLPLLLSGFLLSLCAGAQNYPARPIKMVVAYQAGGATDAFARMVVQKFSANIGQTVIIDNRAGGNSIIGSDYVSKAQPDGYTILLNPASHVLIPFYTKKMPYDALKDFTPIIAAAYNNRCLVVNLDLPVKTLTDFIAYAKSNPGKLSYGVAAAGSAQELAGDLLKFSAGIDMLPVPYKGGGPALQDLLGGQIQAGIFVLADTLQYIKSGRLKALGIIEGKRSKAASSIPTFAEAGVTGFVIPDQWIGVFGPPGLSPDIANKLNLAMNKTLLNPEVRTALESIGYESTGGSMQEFEVLLGDDQLKYRKIAEAIALKPS